MAGDFRHFLAGETPRGFEPGGERLVHDFASVEDAAENGVARHGRFSAENPAEDFFRIGSREANHRDGAFAGRRGDGGDRIARHAAPALSAPAARKAASSEMKRWFCSIVPTETRIHSGNL